MSGFEYPSVNKLTLIFLAEKIIGLSLAVGLAIMLIDKEPVLVYE